VALLAETPEVAEDAVVVPRARGELLENRPVEENDRLAPGQLVVGHVVEQDRLETVEQRVVVEAHVVPDHGVCDPEQGGEGVRMGQAIRVHEVVDRRGLERVELEKEPPLLHPLFLHQGRSLQRAHLLHRAGQGRSEDRVLVQTALLEG